MKPTKQKHGKENIIGKIIYAFLMFIPLFAIGVTCLYVIFNKNAYQSYYGETINQQQTLTTQELTKQTTYKILVGNRTYDETQENIKISASNIKRTFSGNTVTYTANIVEIRKQNNANYFFVYNNNTYVTDFSFSNTSIAEFEFEFLDYINKNNLNTSLGTFTYIQYNSFSFASEVFYYSINKIQENPLFNWSSNTATYSVLQTTCTTLGITPQFIPMLLSYWLMMSLMYLLYDIALLIVHMAHNRIHDIESSM